MVETPAGEITVSSVSAVRVRMGPNLFMDSPSIGVAFVGEAAFVEVAPGRYLFALISNGPGVGERYLSAGFGRAGFRQPDGHDRAECKWSAEGYPA
ncbi:MAG: hypothetical protein U1E69_13410 [Tabrizicola sp.]|uniref:hypothetical protein n=1 Tax=Tabrizicola sp. TaxID=2005166 RepID=UPI002AB993CA|nr:hypothetical protein [Tabrizicola sp.]MDZ4087785.1 hypothetical protein [Tabrizicola sp.]